MAGKAELVARIGGDEFVLLVADTAGIQDVVMLAEDALTAISRPLTIGGRTYLVTASAGLVERPVRAADAADLMRAADITLYWAKADGKDRWAVFDAERGLREVAQYTLTQMLPGALERERVPVALPAADLARRRIAQRRRGTAALAASAARPAAARTGSSPPPRRPGSSCRSAGGCCETAVRAGPALGGPVRRAALRQRQRRDPAAVRSTAGGRGARPAGPQTACSPTSSSWSSPSGR